MSLLVELIIAIVLRLNILPSPTPAVILNRYEKSLFPDFDQLFETPSPSSPMRHLAREPEEASVAIVFENRSEKPITAWRYQWQITDVSGGRRAHTASGDSYTVDVFRPVAEPGSRSLRKIGDVDMGEARLRHLENRPTLPKFYRRLPPSE